MRKAHEPKGSGAMKTPSKAGSATKLPKDRFDLVDNSPLAAALEKRGVVWPVGGYAPGLYVQTCQHWQERHMADKRAMRCLPCALTLAIGAAADHADRFDQGVSEGRRRATETVVQALGIEVLA